MSFKDRAKYITAGDTPLSPDLWPRESQAKAKNQVQIHKE